MDFLASEHNCRRRRHISIFNEWMVGVSDGKELAEKPTTDIVGKDQDALSEFIEAGLPDIGVVDEPQIVKMFDLYLHGRSYNAISGVMRIPKPVVLYLSHKLKWFESREQYFMELEVHHYKRIVEAQLMSQDFLLNMLHSMHKKMGSRLNKYLTSDNEEFSNQINLKELDRYLKIVDMLQKSISKPAESKPLIGINVGTGATITRTGENEIEVTPKEKSMDGMLKHFADMRRKNEKK